MRRAFTLIELLVVLAVAGILISVSFNAFATFKGHAALDQSGRSIVALLTDARARTLSGEGGLQYGVNFATTSVALFSGAVYVPGSELKIVNLDAGVSIQSVSLADSGTSVVFAKQTGITLQSGTTTIALNSNASSTGSITILKTGIAQFSR